MSRRFLLVVLGFALLLPGLAVAQEKGGAPLGVGTTENYPPEVLEKYWECMERTDLNKIKELLWYHEHVEKIDASVYGLPKDDFDDQSLLTIEERLAYRAERARILSRRPNEPRQATSGELQYPHYLREALDHYYKKTGQRPDCSEILKGHGTQPPVRTFNSSWASDLNLTSTDSVARGEVNATIDRAAPNRVMISSCPSGSAPDSSSNFITATSDWGATWSYTAVGNNSGSTWECDPVSYYQTSTGRVYHSKIGCNTGTCGSTFTLMRYSSNNGSSWSDCGRPDSNTSEDRQWHVVDNNPSSVCYGNIYITWHNSNQEKVTTSTTNCSSWASVTNLTGTYSAITPDINVAADGHVYVVWQNHGDTTFKIAGSNDCGGSWTSPSATTVKARLGDWSNKIPAQCQRGVATQPTVDVDRCSWSQYYGRVYVAMFDFDQSGCGTGPGCTGWTNSCDYDIWLSYSDNQGSSWSTPINVTRDKLSHGDKVDDFIGYMRVDESDGTIYIGFQRTRLNPTALADREKTNYFIARSIDGGTTWDEWQVSSLEGDEKVSGASTFERGDYSSLDVYEGVIYPAWIDRRNTSGEEEVITRKICTEPAHRSERAPTFAAPTLTMTSPGAGTVDISWTAPDAQWGDGGENNTQRKYQLWVDGLLAQDNIAWTTTSITAYDPLDCNSHTYFIRAINQCGISKDYATSTYSATGCCTGNPTAVDVTPNGPLTLCTGTAQTLTASYSGGTSPYTFQWYRDGLAISGATSSTYSASDTGTHSYNCEVTGGGCTPGIQDSSATQIAWQAQPNFSGLDSATNGLTSICTIDLAWTAATSPCGGTITYNVYRSTTSGFTPAAGNQIASGVSGTSYSDTDTLVSGTTYYYIVRAVSSANGVEDTNTVERSAAPTNAGSGTLNYPSTDTPISIPDNTPAGVTSTLNIAASGTITDIMLNVNISHTYKGDLIVELTSPGGTTVRVHNRTGGSANDIITTYDSLTAPDGPGLMSDFDGQSITGNWSLWVSDNVGADTGTINSWSLDITTYSACTTGTSCTNPGAVTIGTISDVDACAQSGITIPFSGGLGATSYDLLVDGLTAVSGVTSPISYNPGDSSAHSYVVRAKDGTCYTDSSSSSFTDADNTPATPAAPSVADVDVCAQSGVSITWSAVSGATAYDLLVDGTTALSGVSSPYSYNPGNTASHTYAVRARNASCTGAYSSATSATDAAGSPTPPGAPTVGDVSSCVLSGVQISWGAVTGATSYDLQIDGATTVTGVSSPYTYSPGDSNSHNYAVRSVNTCGNSAWSTATAGVDADHSIGGFAGIRTAADRDSCDDTGVTLSWLTPTSWNDGGTGTRSFSIQRGGSDLQTGISETVTSGVDTTGTNGTSYNYGVVAINGYGCSVGASTTLAATDNVGTAPTFSGLQSVAADSGGGCSLHLAWTAAASGCSSAPGIVYNVYRSTTTGFTPGAGNLLASCVSDLYYDDSSVLTGTTYYYVVRAEDSSNSGGGACNGGNEETNTVEVSGALGSGTSIPINEDFATGNPPTGWTLFDGGTGTEKWTTTNPGSRTIPSGMTTPIEIIDSDFDGQSLTQDDSLMTPAFSASGATSVSLEFDTYFNWYSSADYAYVDVSSDGGGTWTNVVTWTADVGTSSAASHQTLDITTQAAGSANAMVRFHYVGNWGWYWMVDNVKVTVSGGTACTSGAPNPVEHLTARATSTAVKLEWMNSTTGFASARICRDTAGYPTDPAACTPIYTGGTAGAYGTYTDTGLTNGTAYYYTAWVNNGTGTFSTRETVSARPFATTGKAQWAYSSGATALAPNGVYPGAIGTGSTFSVSNDRVLHGMNPTAAGGDWPRTAPYAWKPMAMNGPAQARPPVVPTTVIAGADMVVFLGSEDGHAYAANAKTGATLWQSAALGSILLASPAGMFTAFGGSWNMVFVGSRDAGSANAMYGLNASDGTTAWTFDNGGGGTAVGIISSSAFVDYANNRLYFASRENSTGSNNTMWCLSFTGSSASLLWARALGDIDGAPALYDGAVYVGNNAGEVFALDPVTGATKWSYATGDGVVKGYVYPQFKAVPRDVYFSTSGNIWALTDNGTSVSLNWQRGTIASPSILLEVPGGTDAYVGSSDGKLYQLNIASGAVVTSLTIGDGTATVGNPVMDVINNMVYVGTESGAVYGVNLPLN